MRELNIAIRQQYATIGDAELDARISSILSANFHLGWLCCFEFCI